jgi:hypothetical protein
MQPWYIKITTIIFQPHAMIIIQTLIVRLILQIVFEIEFQPPYILYVDGKLWAVYPKYVTDHSLSPFSA